MKQMLGYDLGDVLDLMGLARKRSVLGMVLPALGLIAAGAAIGVSAGLAFAPASGRRLRHDLREGVKGRIGQMRERIMTERKANGSSAVVSHQTI